MKKKLVFATGNANKTREFREMLDPEKYEVFSMKEAGIEVDIVEDGQTFEENALIKARAVAAHTDSIVVADDSGLEIDAMGKMPGVMSHRWLGDRTYPQAMQDIIEELKDVPEEKRSARFVCSIAACVPGRETMTVQETIEGRVAHEIRGTEGFGYDPFFYVPEFGCTTAEMSREQKNAISHRGKGIRAMRDLLIREGVLG